MTPPVASVQLSTPAEESSEGPSGSLDTLVAIGLKNVEARRAGEGAIECAVIEYDDAPGDVFADTRAGYDILVNGGHAA